MNSFTGKIDDFFHEMVVEMIDIHKDECGIVRKMVEPVYYSLNEIGETSYNVYNIFSIFE